MVRSVRTGEIRIPLPGPLAGGVDAVAAVASGALLSNNSKAVARLVKDKRNVRALSLFPHIS